MHSFAQETWTGSMDESIYMGKKTNENKRMSSIARRINMSFWLKEVGNVILIDIIIAFLIVGAFAWWGRKQLPQAWAE